MNMSNTVRSKTLSQTALVVFGCLIAAGCQNQSQSQLLASHDYRLMHPIVITEEPETLDLPVGRNTRNINGPIESTIAAFGQQSRQKGDGSVEILVPSGGANEAAVHSITPKIRQALQRGGVSRNRISTENRVVPEVSKVRLKV